MNFLSVGKKSLITLIGGLLCSFCITSIVAQTGTTGIRGVVSDQQGAVVAGATVTLSNPEKGFSRAAVTSGDGTYNFASIAPGTYNIEVEKQGFKKHVKNGVTVAVDTPAEISVQLEIGSVGEVVTVTANTIDSIVNTQDASVGNNFQAVQIQQLPTDVRNINSLLTLQPGVTREGYVNGGRSDQANITLDGVDINDQQTGGTANLSTGLNSVLRITAESVEEFRVTTSNPSAAQGRSSGAQISLLSKGGSNDFRGALFYFKRPTFGSANNFFNNRAGVEREGIDRDVFGGALGGPLVRDKLFFFYSYEGQRERTERSVVRVVPLASLGRGEFQFFGTRPGSMTNELITLDLSQLNSIYTQAGMNPDAIAVLADAAARYPANDFSSGQGDNINTGGFRFNAPTPEDLNTHILRLDYNLNSSQQIFGRVNVQHDLTTLQSNFPDTPAPTIWGHNTGVAIGHNWTIGNDKTNTFRYGLTRQAFTSGGDADQNRVSFRFVYTPLLFQYSLERVTPVQNFSDDFTWTKGNHTLQFGGNVRIIRNRRGELGASFDSAVVNPSFYASSGRSVFTPLIAAGYTTNTSSSTSQAAISALVGRFSQYRASYNYDRDGSLLPLGTKIERDFASEEYDVYGQDSWRVLPNLTVNLGLRYALSRPVYEQNGFQVRPTIPLGEVFERRLAAAANGTAYNELIQFELAGPTYDKPGFYGLDKNNFQPRISAAWSPDFKGGFLRKLFGGNSESVFRGGFSITNDYFGQQLAVTFNALSTLGFTTSDNIAANTFNVTTRLAPQFTQFGQSTQNFPFMSAPNRFQVPADEDTRIESSLDSNLVSPIHYNWSFTFGRKLPKGLYIEASYIGRKARNLFLERDVMALNNIVDSQTGADWYTAAGQLHDMFYAGVTVDNVPTIPYFENVFPGLNQLAVAYGLGSQPNSTRAAYAINEAFAGGDWTYLQFLLDDDLVNGRWSNLFFHPQYGAFSAYSTVGKSDYHGGNLSVRQRFGSDLSLDFNYTFAKSMDDASGNQNSGAYGNAFVLNPIRQQDSYTVSDFDVRHSINANGIWQLPFGRGRKFFGNFNPVVNALIGGWQLTGVFRWNTGLPGNNLIDLNGWATNWNVRSTAVRTRPIQASPTRGGNGRPANAFSDLDQLLASVRAPRPGETGDRNVFRGSSYSALDMGLSKSFRMPWSENHKLQVRWEVFNVFNSQTLDEQTISAFAFSQGTPLYPDSVTALSPGTGEFSSIKGTPRRMQFGLRYSF